MDGLDFLGDMASEALTTTALSDDKKTKGGCFIVFLLLILIIGLVIYFSYKEETPNEMVKGVVIYKMSDNRLLVKTSDGENVFTVTQELYTNKNINDSITLKKVEE